MMLGNQNKNSNLILKLERAQLGVQQVRFYRTIAFAITKLKEERVKKGKNNPSNIAFHITVRLLVHSLSDKQLSIPYHIAGNNDYAAETSPSSTIF